MFGNKKNSDRSFSIDDLSYDDATSEDDFSDYSQYDMDDNTNDHDVEDSGNYNVYEDDDDDVKLYDPLNVEKRTAGKLNRKGKLNKSKLKFKSSGMHTAVAGFSILATKTAIAILMTIAFISGLIYIWNIAYA